MCMLTTRPLSVHSDPSAALFTLTRRMPPAGSWMRIASTTGKTVPVPFGQTLTKRRCPKPPHGKGALSSPPSHRRRGDCSRPSQVCTPCLLAALSNHIL